MSNKDEALRAKDIAEDLMRKADYISARRFALKAQRLDGTLENIVHMIMVCEVHCAVLEKSGDETDWYKILQVDQFADDNTIKKQYRKFALHLHPDKNKLPGAESAFKTIGEAQRVLVDKEKRRIHDMRRKPVKRPSPAVPSFQHQQAPATAHYTTQPVFPTNVNAARNSFMPGLRPENLQKSQAQPTGFSGLSLWTSCAFCHKQYQYERKAIKTLLTCLTCGKQYVALEKAFQGPPVQATNPIFQQSKVPTQEAGKVAQKQPENSASFSPRKEGFKAKGPGPATENSNGKRKRKMVLESSGSSFSSSSNEFEWVATGGQDSGSTGGQHSRRSVRSKQQVSYNENISDDNKKEEDVESAEESDVRKKDSSSGSAADVEISECADPDFSNFEKSREERCFQSGQIWAMYDNNGKMPRYYGVIRKVSRKPSFMLKFTWLEADPDDEKTKQWIRKKLPVSVGKFKVHGDELTDNTPWFSHLIRCRESITEDIVSVYPRKGETWALFKNWDISWSSGRRRPSHEYEFVEILSEYAEGAAIEVAFLRKVRGFASVFCRIPTGGGSSDTIQIPPHELLRFSHSIPSTKLTGKEGSGVPAGSYELDTAALPQKLEEEEDAVPVSRKAGKPKQVKHRSSPSSEPDCVLIPNFQFHDFSAEKLEGKFASGQIWSLKAKEDDLPKCYAKIQKVLWKPVFKLHINRLEPGSPPGDITQWRDKKMLVSCGNFTLKEGQVETLTNVTGFSHLIAKQRLSKNEFTVLPKTGEIWAMYKNWSDTIRVASLRKCEYEVVEVLDDNERQIEVMMLERVHGFVSVFKEKVEGCIDVKKTIPRCELLRFSHFVPSFRLTGERNGALRGYVELDPAALSRNLRKS